MRALPCAYIDRARTPTEGRTACPTLCFYIQDNDVHGGVRKRAAALHRFLGLSLRSAHSRRASIYGRSVGKAILRFLYLLRTANARHRRAHQSDASARIFCVLRRVFWSPQGHLVGDAASGRACILCASARSKERGASPQNLRTSAPFVARHCLCPRSTFYRSLKYGNYRFRGTPQAYYS